MDLQPENILVAHPSAIVFLGFSSAIRMANCKGEIAHATTYQQMEIRLKTQPFARVYLSPQLVVNCDEQFLKLKTRHNCCWVALVLDLLPRKSEHLFDETLYLDENIDAIIRALQRPIVAVSEPTPTNLSLLSDREKDVLRLLVEGFSNKEIAEKLFISTHTVISHRKNIVQKTGIHSVAGLTIYAVANKLIGVEDYFS
jgi:DNA-binding CsgD family transcriptional regulator